MSNQKLYSSLQEERIAAAKNINDEVIIKELLSIKKYYWYGSANAWLVFLGISPGGSSPKGKEDISNYTSQFSFKEESKHLLEFNDSKREKGFWGKIREYIKELFPNISQVSLYKTTLAGNLIDTQEGDSKKLQASNDSKKKLEEGAIESFKVLSIVKPKVVICLQKDVYNLLYKLIKESNENEIEKDQILIVNSGTKRNINYKVPITFLRSKDELWNKWILTKTPMHPSRSNFCSKKNFTEQFLQKLILMANDYLDI